VEELAEDAQDRGQEAAENAPETPEEFQEASESTPIGALFDEQEDMHQLFMAVIDNIGAQANDDPTAETLVETAEEVVTTAQDQIEDLAEDLVEFGEGELPTTSRKGKESGPSRKTSRIRPSSRRWASPVTLGKETSRPIRC
jgi:hypothetical protein